MEKFSNGTSGATKPSFRPTSASADATDRRLVAAIACRNQGSRLYGKPVQNLDVERRIRIIDHIVDCLRTLDPIDEIVFGISEGVENGVFESIASEKGLRYVVGDELDVLSRLVKCGELADATDIFRITSESPFLYFEPVEELWERHQRSGADATFMDEIIDGCGFEIITLDALKRSHSSGEAKHRSEFCTLYIREHEEEFVIIKETPPTELIRRDLRLTVDNPEDLVVCRAVFREFRDDAPRISVARIVEFLDANPDLIELARPFAEDGYATMYR